MTDVPNRDELEARLAKALAKLTRLQMSRLIEALGDPPRIENIPSGFWEEAGQELRKVLSPFLEQVYLDQAGEILSELPVGVDWTLVNQRAVVWAQNYSFELVKKLTQTTQALLRQTVSAYFEQGLTIGDLESRLMQAFGPVRAEMIAVTEVTRAASQGEQAVAAELHDMGIDMTPIWQTNNDELVCPLCGPKHARPIKDGKFPPEHPRCRCWVNYELPKVKR